MGWAFILAGRQVEMGKGLSHGLGSSNFPLMPKAQEEDVSFLVYSQMCGGREGKGEGLNVSMAKYQD